MAGRILCSVLVVTVGLAGAAEGWPQYGGPGGSCATTADNQPMIEAWIDARELWRSDRPIPDGQCGDSRKPFRDGQVRLSGGYASPICDAEAVYLQYYEPAGDPDAALVAKHGDAVADKFRVEADDVLHCFDAVTGTTRWRSVFEDSSLNMQGFTKAGPSQTPCLGDGRLYAQLNGGLVVALDQANGEEIWRYRTPRFEMQESYRQQARQQQRLAGFNRDFVSSPLFLAGTLVFNDHLHCKVTPPGASKSEYHYDIPSNLIALDAATGAERWRLSAGVANTSQPLAWQDGERTWLIVDSGAIIRCLDPGDGTQRWRIEDSDGSRILIDGDHLVIGRKEKKTAWLAGYHLSADGAELLWEQRDHGRPRHLAARDGILYFDDRQGALVALDLSSGQVVGRAPSTVETHFGCYPILVGSLIVCAGSDSDRIHLYDASDPAALRLLDHQALPHAWGYTMPILPAAADGRIYLRHHDALIAWDLRADPAIAAGAIQLALPGGLLDGKGPFTTRLRLRDGDLGGGLSRRGDLTLTATTTDCRWDGQHLVGRLALTTPDGGVESYHLSAERSAEELTGHIAPTVAPFPEPLPLSGAVTIVERQRWMPDCSHVLRLAEASRTISSEAKHLYLFVSFAEGAVTGLSAIADHTVKSWPAIDADLQVADGVLQGTVKLRYRPDRWSTALVHEGSCVAASYDLRVPLAVDADPGSYTGSWGVAWHEQRPITGRLIGSFEP